MVNLNSNEDVILRFTQFMNIIYIPLLLVQVNKIIRLIYYYMQRKTYFFFNIFVHYIIFKQCRLVMIRLG